MDAKHSAKWLALIAVVFTIGCGLRRRTYDKPPQRGLLEDRFSGHYFKEVDASFSVPLHSPAASLFRDFRKPIQIISNNPDAAKTISAAPDNAPTHASVKIHYRIGSAEPSPRTVRSTTADVSSGGVSASTSNVSQMVPEEFSIPTEDRVTRLHGDIMLPEGRSLAGALLMVPGGCFAQRDGFLGDSYTEADLMYRRIANRVAHQGYVVARYDNRGVAGNEFTIGIAKDSADPAADSERYLKTCIDSEIRRTVTPESLSADAFSVYRFVASQFAVDPQKIVVLGHSEGGIHVARLIGSGRIHPAGVVLANSIADSPKAVFRWQVIDRYVNEMMNWPREQAGRVTVADVAASFATSFLPEVGFTEQELYPRNGAWNEAELRAFFTDRYEQQKSEALELPNDAPYPKLDDDTRLNFVIASNRWWKQWFVDETRMIDLLSEFSGRIAFHFGEIDRQQSSKCEIDCIRQRARSMVGRPTVVLHSDRGHAFGRGKPLSGPMDQESEDLLVNEIAAVFRAD